MTKWFRNWWIVFAVFSLVLLLAQCGCTRTYEKPTTHYTIHYVTNKSPFSDTVGENLGLTDCQQAEKRMQIAMKLHDVLLKNMYSTMTDEELKDVVMAEVRALYEYVYDIRLWMSDNCSEA